MYSVCQVVPCTWHQAPGSRFQDPGSWNQVLGTWRLASGTWCQAPGIFHQNAQIDTNFETKRVPLPLEEAFLGKAKAKAKKPAEADAATDDKDRECFYEAIFMGPLNGGI